VAHHFLNQSITLVAISLLSSATFSAFATLVQGVANSVHLVASSVHLATFLAHLRALYHLYHRLKAFVIHLSNNICSATSVESHHTPNAVLSSSTVLNHKFHLFLSIS
jgi:hypothetical protein